MFADHIFGWELKARESLLAIVLMSCSCTEHRILLSSLATTYFVSGFKRNDHSILFFCLNLSSRSQDVIQQLIAIRARNKISSTSEVRILACHPNLYVARVGRNVQNDGNGEDGFQGVIVKLGPSFDMCGTAPGDIPCSFWLPFTSISSQCVHVVLTDGLLLSHFQVNCGTWPCLGMISVFLRRTLCHNIVVLQMNRPQSFSIASTMEQCFSIS